MRVASALLRGKTSFHIWKRINYRYVCFVISFTSWNGIGGTRSDVYSNITMGKDDLIYGVSGDIFYSIIKIGRASR